MEEGKLDLRVGVGIEYKRREQNKRGTPYNRIESTERTRNHIEINIKIFKLNIF